MFSRAVSSSRVSLASFSIRKSNRLSGLRSIFLRLLLARHARGGTSFCSSISALSSLFSLRMSSSRERVCLASAIVLFDALAWRSLSESCLAFLDAFLKVDLGLGRGLDRGTEVLLPLDEAVQLSLDAP